MCPECSPANNQSLKYFHGSEDTIRVMCCTVEKHFYQTFKLNQLNHKIAMINAGKKYPIPFGPSAYGPPVNICGVVLNVTQKGKNTSTKTKRAPPSLKCQQVRHGATAAKHKSAGHTGCILKYCKSPPTVPDIPDALITPPGFHVAPSAILPNPKRPRVIQPQCAQSIRRGHSALEEARKRQAEAGLKHPVILHLFQTWPVSILEDCKSLVHQAKQAAGSTWDDSLLVWDEEVKNWVTLPSQHIALADELQGVLECFGMGKPKLPSFPIDLRVADTLMDVGAPVDKQCVASAPTVIIDTDDKDTTVRQVRDDTTPPNLPPTGQCCSSQAPIWVSDPSDLESDSEISQEKLVTFFGPSLPNNQPSTPDYGNHLDPSLLGPCNEKGSSSSDTLPLQEWPGEKALAATLIRWYLASCRLEFILEEPTAYCYWKFVHHVGPEKMQQWVQEWPAQGEINQSNVTVSRLRRHFKCEFNEVKDLGWKALPFDQPPSHTNNQVAPDLVFGLIPCDGEGKSPPEVSKYKWGCNCVDINIDPKYNHVDFDSRLIHHAVLHKGACDMILDACALQPQFDNIGHHLCLAQMYVHASCLLESFKMIVRERIILTESQEKLLCKLCIVQNVVMRRADYTNVNLDSSLVRWFHLREPVHGLPKYNTSNSEFSPQNHANTFLGRLLACFTHWRYKYHGHHALFCGFHGYNGIITNVTIMDDRCSWFLQNPSTGGLQTFTATHICQTLCEKLGLVQPPSFYPMGGAAPIEPFC
ncbi:hypothetical protein DFH28DRAFT_1087883 [Melampsora americana]|nr:hypothetical protein DFH28DRAFT_1087883 [Melampsora americana]